MDPTPRNLPFRSVYSWLDRRIPLSPFVEFLSKKEVPRHKHSIWYYFGGLTLFFLIVQIISGILLLMYYQPSPDSAHESIVYITNEVPFGWIIRSVHSWGANLMVAMILIHMFSVYLMKAYRKPREMMWLTG
ncbi:MAG: cytochrome b N-terminal domain-containing protein, partial [Bacteroidota bacterium]